MVDYRKRLVDMTPEERAEVAPSADNFSKVFGDRTEEPMSVTAADTAVSLATPVDSVVEVQKELQKEEPDYLKIGMLAGVEALGSIPALGPVAKSMVRKGADLAKQTDNVIKLPPKKRSFENFNFDELNLSDAEIEAYADIYNRLDVAGSGEALNKAGKRIADTIKAREPKIEKALSDALSTNKGIVTLQDYKNAVAATANYDNIEDAAKVIADEEQLLNKMGASIANDMSFDDAVDSVFDVYYSKGASNDDLTESLLNAGYQQELVNYAVTENAIRKSYNNFISNKGTGDVPSKPRPLTLDATSDAVDDLGFSEKDLADWKKVNYAKDKFRIPPDDEMAAAATNLREGKITSEEFRKLSDERQPIKPITEMPKFPTKEEVVKALHATDPRKTKKGVLGVNKSIDDGTLISSRLDIPAYNNSDTWVVSLHDGSVKDGKTVGYGQSAVLNNVNFTSNPLAASKIATGSAKTTIARMQGEWQNMDPEEVYKTVESLFDDPDWVQVGMNPYRASYFYDKADGMPVVSAEQVMQVGPLVFAKKAKKTTPDDPQFEFENKVTGVKANFNEGGMAMEEQTQMAFALGGSVEDVDPVSGNEVPPGSLPEEVRDDIDARLSEGEYVVPADVVRYYGVKFFEDLRNQAKAGFEDMEANGRIGGQPVPDENSLPFDVSELQVEEEPVQMNEGGLLDREALEAKFPASFMGSSGPAQEWKTFENEAGLTITIRFVDGKPMSVIPAGYTEVGARSEQALEAPKGDDSDPQFGDPSNAPEAVDLSSLSTDELEKLGNSAADAGTIEKVLGYGSPLLGDILGLTREMKAANINAEIVKRLKSGTNIDGTPLTKSDITQLGKMFDTTVDDEDSGSFFFGGQRSLTEGLQNNSGDYEQGVGAPIVGFADTFLGDLLGFDGTPGIQATDKDGNKLGLDASISGKRRKPVEKPTVTTPSNNDGGDDNYSAADAMRDRLDKQTKDEGQTGGFQGSATGSSVYAGGNRAEGGLMMKKDKKKKK